MKKSIAIREVERTDDLVMRTFLKSIGVSEEAEFNIMHAVVKPAGSTDRDQHKVREYWFIVHGSGELVLNDTERINVEKGELYFFPSMLPHQIFNHSQDENLELLSIWW